MFTKSKTWKTGKSQMPSFIEENQKHEDTRKSNVHNVKHLKSFGNLRISKF